MHQRFIGHALLATLLCLFSTQPVAGAVTQLLPSDPYDLSFPDDAAPDQVIEPGGEGHFAFTLHWTRQSAGDAVVAGVFYGEPQTASEYVFEPESPRCGVPTIEIDFGREFTFVVKSMALGETMTCRYRILRMSASRNDLKFESCGDAVFPYCDRAFRRGSLPDLGLTAVPLTPTLAGARSATVRLQLRNRSDRPVLHRDVTTDCEEFEGGLSGPGPFVIDGDIPGGCPVAPGEDCFNLGGQSYLSYGFRLGPVAAGGSASCLVRLTFAEPLAGRLQAPLYFVDDVVPYADGAVGFDADGANDSRMLSIAPPANATTVPLSPLAGLLAAVLLGWSAFCRLRQR